MNPFSLSGILIGISSFFLGIFIFWKSQHNKVNRIWSIFCFFVAIFGFGSFAVGSTLDPDKGLFWWKIAYIGIIFIPVLYYHFVSAFLQLKSKIFLYLLYLYGFFFLIIEWSHYANLFFGPENITLFFNSLFFVYPPTPLFMFFVVSWFGIIVYSHVLLYDYFKNSLGIRREQIKYFFIATATGFAGGSTCFLPCFGINFYPYFNFAVPLYPAIITYAIVVHRLMDIKMVMRRYSVY
ncbi:MAG TPA: hypothetical protein DHI91_03100, partial [Candidatus Portnoybacteria bacterium]|nr:hypothetical protein [Candidatus Portnoybacteria bacterium]